jgi:hypothetical protein
MATRTRLGFEEAISAFVDCLGSYRGYSVHTVKAYAAGSTRALIEEQARALLELAPAFSHPARAAYRRTSGPPASGTGAGP